MKRTVSVQIGGKRYSLRSDTDEATVREIAAYVDERLRQVQQTSRAYDTQATATLTALRIAEELFAERKALADLKRRIRDKGRALLSLLERAARV